jgi:hypothetical protein
MNPRQLTVRIVLGGAVFLSCGAVLPETRKPQPPPPDQFVVGRRTFFDIGPPFEFYEILSLRSTTGGALVERLQVTPPGDACTQPATVEVSTASIRESVADLLGGTNPCTIPEKDLRRERKRCKKCLVFSGADVTMQVSCGGQSRRIRMDILDRDMFDPHAGTPEHTSWTMALMGRLDQALGSNIMERPAFTLSGESRQLSPKPQSSPMLEDLERGTFDALFDRGSYRPSELYRQARNPPPEPSVELVSSSPFRPSTYTLPKYPPIARAAHVSGQVTFTVSVESDGHPSPPSFLSGNPLIQRAVTASISDWTFPTEATGEDVRVTIQFNMNCVSAQR